LVVVVELPLLAGLHFALEFVVAQLPVVSQVLTEVLLELTRQQFVARLVPIFQLE
jgi:hypothetical protein